MGKKVILFCALALFFMHTVSAFETPDMVAADISGTALQPYYISTVEVTQAFYQEITGKNPSSCVQETAAFAKLLAGEAQENRPVESLTFFDALQFCNLLTEKTLGKDQCVYTLSGAVYDSRGRIIRFADVKADFSKTGYRLPTRAEWANAAGQEPAAKEMYSWFVDNSAARGEGRTGFGTHAVAKKLPNAEGLYDMYGNVAEMCHEGENLELCIVGTAWNRLDDFYPDGYVIDWLYGYSEYTVSRNHVRESFPGFDTCGFRLCRSISDLPFSLETVSVPDVCDTYDGIVPVSVTGSGFLCRRTEPLSVRVEGFASTIAGNVQWLSDESAIIPVQAEPFKIQNSQLATLRVIIESAGVSAEQEGTLTRIHTEFPVHPADILLDDGTVMEYEEGHVFSGFEKEHAAAVIIYAPYDGTEILALGLSGFNLLSATESLDDFIEEYGERTGIFGAYLGSGWYIPSSKEIEPLADAAFRKQTGGILRALEAESAAAFEEDGHALLTTDSKTIEGLFVPVKRIDTRALITQKYEYLIANDLLKEAAAQDALLAAQMAAEEAAAREAQALAEKERIAREKAEAEAAVLAAAQEAEAAAVAELEEKEEESTEPETEPEEEQRPAGEARTLIGFGLDVLELTDSVQTFTAELSTGLVFPFLYLSAEGNFTLGIETHDVAIMGFHYTTYSIVMPYWDAALSLGFSARLKLGSFHPDLFVSAGALINRQLMDEGRYVNVRLETGLDIPLGKRLTLTARYSADPDQFSLDGFLNNSRLSVGFAAAFPSFILF